MSCRDPVVLGVICLACQAPRAASVMLHSQSIVKLLAQVLAQVSSKPVLLCWSRLVPCLLVSGIWRPWVSCKTISGC